MLLISVLTGLGAEAGPLRVVCWNLHHGEGADGRVDLDRIARQLTALRPDLVALQEVDRRCGRSGGADQAAELARLTGLEPVFGRAMDFDGGEYGLAVLSRLPVESHRIHRLPGDGEPRIALEVVVRHDGGTLSVVSTHLDHQQAERREAQARALAKALGPRRAAVLCGDFNDGPGSPTLRAFDGGWTAVAKRGPAATHPAADPRVEIDHVLIKGLVARKQVTVVEETRCSDHRPLWLEVAVAGE